MLDGKGGESVTLEEAMEKIVLLNETVNQLNEEKQSMFLKQEEYETTIVQLQAENQRVKESNMRYFEKLAIQQSQTSNIDDQLETNQEVEPKDWNDFMQDWG